MEVIEVKVFPNKRRTEIIKKEGNSYILNVAASPEQNKANIELCKFLQKHLRKKVSIIRGFTSHKKLIRLLP